MAAHPVPPAPYAPLPERLTLPALQRYVAKVVEERGYTRDLDRVFILLVEELGELAEQMMKRRRAEQAPARSAPAQELAFELADVTLYLADLANGLSVDLASALAGTATSERPATGRPPATNAPAPPDPRQGSLGEWQRWAAAAGKPAGATPAAGRVPGAAGADWLELIEATGRMARHLRLRWARQAGDAAAALSDALRAALTLAEDCGVDLSAALREKEEINRGRTWTV